MTDKSELEHLESQCTDAAQWTQLALRALEELSDAQYARQLVQKAEMECQDPCDFVAVAKLYANHLEDSEYAADLLDQGEMACFEPMEFAEIGDAYATLLNDAAKGLELLQNAVDEVTAADDLMQVSVYASNCGDAQLAKSLLNKATSDLKTVEQFVDLAAQLAQQGSIEQAKSVFAGGKRHLDSVPDAVNYARRALALFDNREQANELLSDAEMDCQFPADFTALASGYSEILQDSDKVDELLSEAADSAMEGSEFLDVGFGYWRLKQDGDSAKNYFEEALSDISDRTKLTEVASFIADEILDKALARRYYEKAAQKIVTPADFVKLGEEIWNKMADREYACELFNLAESKMANAGDLVSLAETIMATVADTAMVESIYQKAALSIDGYPGLKRIYESQLKTVNHPQIGREVLSRMKTLAETSGELLEIFDYASADAANLDFSRTILSAAEQLAAGPADFESVLSHARENFPNDRTWHNDLEDKLERRKANQAKYADFLKKEKTADSAVQCMRLARAIMSELDDTAYARKMLDRSAELMHKSAFDVSQWQMMLDIAASDLKDEELVRKIALEASESCNGFSSAYQLIRGLGAVAGANLAEELTRKILSDWDARMEEPMQRVGFARAVFELLHDAPWASGILERCKTETLSPLEFAQCGVVADKTGNESQALDFFETAFSHCSEYAPVAELENHLRLSGIDFGLRKKLYRSARDSLANESQRLNWSEGILLHFNDREWAKDEYDELAGEISDETLLAAYRVSRKFRLERRI